MRACYCNFLVDYRNKLNMTANTGIKTRKSHLNDLKNLSIKAFRGKQITEKKRYLM